MEIGLIYSSKDPRQTKTREFLRRFVSERGILARFVETERPVKTPTVSINGRIVTCSSVESDSNDESIAAHIPTTKDLTRALEKSIWCL
ncbi:MAG: hypothetical protein OEV49_16995 [candidate division Zixibacteria bacterium]|nr:hypothetical protein [candidate division Zixibacteria bacterium]MDH3936626.1 hypothetical protein [candidate division Zixibacteria bacterium]MDH4034832.1 hypothetical protein [candidate division Zixibacteria bacterium]